MMPSPDHTTPETASIRLPNRRDEIDRAEESLLAALERHGYGDSSRFAVRLAVEEAISNAFNHGHSTLPPTTPVQFDYSVTPAEVRLSVEDQGPGFTPEAVPDPTSDENLELPSGRGLLLMRAYMASVEYSGRGNIVKMVYRKPNMNSTSA